MTCWKIPFYDCFWIAACSRLLFEFHKVLSNARTQGLTLVGNKRFSGFSSPALTLCTSCSALAALGSWRWSRKSNSLFNSSTLATQKQNKSILHKQQKCNSQPWQFTLVTQRPYCPGRPKELCFTTLSLAMETMGMRLSVVKQSFFGPPGQYGRLVTRANSCYYSWACW